MPVCLDQQVNRSGFTVLTPLNNGEFLFSVYSTLGLGSKDFVTTGWLGTNNDQIKEFAGIAGIFFEKVFTFLSRSVIMDL